MEVKFYNHLLKSLFLKTFLLLFLLLTNTLAAQSADFSVEEFSQIKEQQLDLETALKKLAKKYDANLLFDPEFLKNKKVKESQLKGTSLEAVLKKILPPLRLAYKKLGEKNYVIKPMTTKSTSTNKSTSGIKVKPNLPAKKKPVKVMITGRVTDADTGEPLIGVNVKENITNTGTATDYDGIYSLETEENATLFISYIGYVTKSIKVKGRREIDIILSENVAQLDEVVVIGYGSTKRSDLTGSLSSVSEKELKQLPSTGLDQALQGRAAGVFVTQNSGSPGGAVSIRIRGIASATSSEPLYVIDGVPVFNDNQGTSSNFAELDGGGQNTNALNSINPNDIESIEILKDASATAIFGARGANGVILITTKRGSAGRSNISFETYFGTQKIAKKIPVMNGYYLCESQYLFSFFPTW